MANVTDRDSLVTMIYDLLELEALRLTAQQPAKRLGVSHPLFSLILVRLQQQGCAHAHVCAWMHADSGMKPVAAPVTSTLILRIR